MSQLFKNKSRIAGSPQTILDRMLVSLTREHQKHGSTGFASTQVAAAAMAFESIDGVLENEVETSVANLSQALESIMKDHGGEFTMGVAQREAAVTAGVISGNIPQFLQTPVGRAMVATENMSFVAAVGGDFLSARSQVALEAYDARDNKTAVVYSVAYNAQASRQDAFGEAFFPTVNVTPDQPGFGVSIRLIQVQDDIRRQVNGAVQNFKRRNIIHAVIDPTILKNDATKLVPVYRAGNEDKFVDASVLAPRNVNLEGQTIPTSALKVGTPLSLLGLSQTDALIETGLMDVSDSLDTAITLESLYVLAPGAAPADARVFKINTARLQGAVFTNALQGDFRAMNLTFASQSLRISKDTKAADGSAVPAFAAILAGDYSVRLGINLSGSANLETSTTNVFASGALEVVSITAADGTDVSMTAGAGLAIFNAIKAMTVVGYDLDSRRTNLNLRERGQLLNTTFYNQVYAVPLRSPVTVLRPMGGGDVNDSSDLAALITATRIRTSNAAVEEILRFKDTLKEFVNAADKRNDSPQILGVASFLVKPYFKEEELNLLTAIDSVKSHERAADTRAVIVNKLRDMAYRMHRDSGYKAASDALAGGVAPKPTVIIGTDLVTAEYLMVEGDLRTLGNEFDIKIVTTQNMFMFGKIVMSFGQFGEGYEGVPNPMHFGNMAWKPEIAMVLPLHRNGGNSKELTVSPAFLHVVNLPILAVLNVKGIEDVVATKITLNMHTVP
jgi:hypothetical protein